MCPSEATEILRMYHQNNYDYYYVVICETYTDISVTVSGWDIIENIIANDGILNVDYIQDFDSGDGSGNIIKGYSLGDLKIIE